MNTLGMGLFIIIRLMLFYSTNELYGPFSEFVIKCIDMTKPNIIFLFEYMAQNYFIPIDAIGKPKRHNSNFCFIYKTLH